MSRLSSSRQVLGLLGWLALTFAAAAAGAVASSDAWRMNPEVPSGADLGGRDRVAAAAGAPVAADCRDRRGAPVSPAVRCT